MTSPNRPPRHKAFLADIGPYIPNYLPRVAVTNLTGKLSVHPIMGVEGVGKNTLIELSELHRVKARTSGFPIPGDTRHDRYYDFTKVTDRNTVTRGIQEGTYVQMMIRPANGELHTTVPKDFARPGPNLFDVTTEEYRRIGRDGWFGTVKPTYIVTSTYERWRQRWAERDGDNPSDHLERLNEAKSSLEFFMQQPEMPVIINDDATASAQLLREVILGETTLTPEYLEQGRAAAQLLLDGIVQNHPDV